jgi:hypothetical protein
MSRSSELRYKKRKMVLRAIRITEDLDDELHRDAESRNMTLSALISSILTRHVEWDRYAERFGFVTIANDSFARLVGSIEDDKIVKIAQELGANVPRELAMFWFKKSNLDKLLELISLFGKYSGTQKCEIERDGGNFTLVLRHNLGEKWSLFLKNFIDEAIKAVTGTLPQCELVSQAVFFSFLVQ